MIIEDTLPNTLWELFTVALRDYEEIKKNPDYIVNMGTWHSFHESNKKCYVCMAGCVMANTLKVERTKNYSHRSFPIPIYNKLRAIDCFRCGDVINAYQIIYQRTCDLQFSYSSYEDIITHLKELGL